MKLIYYININFLKDSLDLKFTPLNRLRFPKDTR